mgnify:CR=1 FL=1
MAYEHADDAPLGTNMASPGCCRTSIGRARPRRGYSEDEGPNSEETSSPNTSRSKEVSAAGKNRQRFDPQTFAEYKIVANELLCRDVPVRMMMLTSWIVLLTVVVNGSLMSKLIELLRLDERDGAYRGHHLVRCASNGGRAAKRGCNREP